MSDTVRCEKELLLRVARGDEHGFAELFRGHHQRLGSLVYRVTGSMELAEEVVQDTFLKIWLNRGLLANVDNFAAYLFVISKNHALNCLRKLAKERLHQKAIEDNALQVAGSGEDQARELYQLLDEAIDHLPPQQQKVYLLSRHKRLKYDEIAAQMGLSRETVKKYLQASNLSITNFVQSHHEIILLMIIAAKLF